MGLLNIKLTYSSTISVAIKCSPMNSCRILCIFPAITLRKALQKFLQQILYINPPRKIFLRLFPEVSLGTSPWITPRTSPRIFYNDFYSVFYSWIFLGTPAVKSLQRLFLGSSRDSFCDASRSPSEINLDSSSSQGFL